MKNIVILFLLLSSGLHAQSEASVVEMTPAELQSIVRRLATLRHRRLALLRRQSARTKTTSVAERDTVYLTPPTSPPPTYREDLAALHRRLDYQERLLLRRDTTVIATRPAGRDTIVRRILEEHRITETPLNTEELRTLEEEMRRMNRTLTALEDELRYERDRRREAERELRRGQRDWDRQRDQFRDQKLTLTTPTPTSPPTTIRDTVRIETQSVTPVYVPTTPQRDTVTIYREVAAEPIVRVDTVRREVAVVTRDTVTRTVAREPIGFPTIFFGNNASSLTPAHRQLLAATAATLRERPGYVVRITGYASPAGNAAYNQELSARRAEAVRRGLTAAGVAADRIRVVPGGVDHEPASAAAARRVEVQALPQ